MKLVVKEGREDPRSPIRIERNALGPNLVWTVVYWTPTKLEITSHLWGLLKGYRAPTNEQFAELVTSFIPNNAIVYSWFESHLGEIPSIVQDMNQLGLWHDFPGKKTGAETVLGEVNKDFVSNALKNNSSWESLPWTFLVVERRVEGLADELAKVCRGGFVTKTILDTGALFLRNAFEHGVDVLSYRMSYRDLEEIATRTAESLNWELEIVRETVLPSKEREEVSHR